MTDRFARNIAIVAAVAFVIVMAVMLTDIWGADFKPPARWGEGIDSAKWFVTLADGTHFDSTDGAARADCARYDSTITGLSDGTAYLVTLRMWDGSDSASDWTFYWPILAGEIADILAEVENIDAWNPITDNDSLIIDMTSLSERPTIGDTIQREAALAAELTKAIDSTNALLDTLQVWDTRIDSIEAALADANIGDKVWVDAVTRAITAGVLTASEWEKVWHDIDTTNIDTSEIGEWFSTGVSASLSDANIGKIADSTDSILSDAHGSGSWATSGAGTYTIDIYAFDTHGGTTTSVEGANVDFRLWDLGQPSHRTVTTGASGAGRIATDVGSLAVRIEYNPFYVFPTVWDSLTWTTDSSDTIYGYLNMPAAAASPNYVRAYVDIGEGIIDSASGNMIPRTAIQLYLELIGHPTLNDGSWMIVPKRQVKSPDANGRVNFIIPANTVLTPEGSYYILSFRAYDGTQQITGELKRFIVDTIPDPILILDATETW